MANTKVWVTTIVSLFVISNFSHMLVSCDPRLSSESSSPEADSSSTLSSSQGSSSQVSSTSSEDLFYSEGESSATSLPESSSEVPVASTITFDSNGGSSVSPINGLSGNQINAPMAPTRAGFVFAGWYWQTTLSTPFVFDKMPAGETVLYADWETSSLVFTLNNGTYSVDRGDTWLPSSIWVPKYHSGLLVTEIAMHGLSGIQNVTQIKLPDSLLIIGDDAFATNNNLATIEVYGAGTYKSVDGILYSGNGKTLVCYPQGRPATSFSISEGVTTIGYHAFGGAPTLASVSCPDSLKTISERAFMGCSGLVTINIPEGVTSIGDYAFYGCHFAALALPSTLATLGVEVFRACSYLVSITVASANSHFQSLDGNLLNKLGDTFIQYAPGKSNGVFSIPSGVTTIGYMAFYSCYNLVSLTFPSGLLRIFDEAFEGCGKLANINLPDGLQTIGDYAFASCGSLTQVTIPASVSHVGYSAFSYDSQIKIYCGASSQPSGWDLSWNPNGYPVYWNYIPQ